MQYTGQRFAVCIYPFWQMHFFCFALNASLAYTILARLARCELDYFQRYYQMLLFTQLTPWSTFRDECMVKHWNLLPTFDLNTPGVNHARSPRNVEAWNKLRLFLQSYNIAHSTYQQVSVWARIRAWPRICRYKRRFRAQACLRTPRCLSGASEPMCGRPCAMTADPLCQLPLVCRK